MLPLVIIGGGGHAAVLAETARAIGLEVAGYTAPDRNNRDIAPYLGNDAELGYRYAAADACLVVGVGSTKPVTHRESLFRSFTDRGYPFATLVHPSAIVSPSATLGPGAQVLAGCIIQAGVVIGENVILNTGVSIDHDSRVGDHTHIAPRAVLCGGVTVGRRAHIGPSAVLIQNAQVSDDGFVRAGEIVVHARH